MNEGNVVEYMPQLVEKEANFMMGTISVNFQAEVIEVTSSCGKRFQLENCPISLIPKTLRTLANNVVRDRLYERKLAHGQ